MTSVRPGISATPGKSPLTPALSPRGEGEEAAALSANEEYISGVLSPNRIRLRMR